MLKFFQPKVNEFTTFSNYVLLWVKSGQGLIEVDFKIYSDFENKFIFLSPHQNIKFLFGNFEIALLQFPNHLALKSQDYRVLFKHLISLGYVEFRGQEEQVFTSLFNKNAVKILETSTNQWFWQNPFNASKAEYTTLFDLKDTIDAHFNENWSINQFISTIHNEHNGLRKLVKNRLGLTIKNLAQKKLLIESQKEIALTNKPIKEVAYDMGFKDPAYFTRFFKQQTHLTPWTFRKNFGDPRTDTFIQDLMALIYEHHKSNHTTAFYADKMYMSIKTISRKVKDKLNITVGDLVRTEIINSAKKSLPNLSIKETAFELGFEEANHFSAFFKKYTGVTPSQFQSKKYNS